ncbi:ABC transporter ATP-binding protein [Pandoraea pnomenusa]|jgi:branched-chain amino acid transport system ATP-binding protein|uniref:ABC transporter ATP-binding protein n=1 Tax=Pandoraea pnomenusa TaxID=93220 RepID=A0A378YQZ0_9BURK|nr:MULTISPECIES: ABC transporter ATP-binding protein [Pandoraea]AHB07777.1 ABC transporter ATP-binding protein [Pandoraea pnomenusa 3kgm]AHB76028.1 ABC transporter ATP-binding protein [Pandoraea pnomenusa]AHN75645.1 ABC transporter ATP-binding protein [Pandoraea pnomenusa]AIU27772.1 ABC transporter ATP-binding protein [Pandoraea pnomenusa]ANC44912.1 ABC transporter ATP-binding protein [Pandoraea pnomenusa]
MTDMLLEAGGLSAGYGETIVLEDLSLRVAAGEAVAILGRNGVGKSTLLLSLLGLTTRHGGVVRYRGDDISSWPAYRRARAGLALVPQEREIFKSLSVEENLQVSAMGGDTRATSDWSLERVYDLFPRLHERRRNLGNQLSGGEQQMLAIGRALIGNPRVILFDEPFEGLAPVIVDQLVDAFWKLRADGGMGVVLVEQHAELGLELTDRALVLDRGREVWSGRSSELAAAPELLGALVGLESV